MNERRMPERESWHPWHPFVDNPLLKVLNLLELLDFFKGCQGR
jgi:hypothetical protein